MGLKSASDRPKHNLFTMTDERWREVVDKVKTQFLVRDEGRREIEDIPRAFAEYIIFETPQGQIKMERVTQPVVLDKKSI